MSPCSFPTTITITPWATPQRLKVSAHIGIISLIIFVKVPFVEAKFSLKKIIILL